MRQLGVLALIAILVAALFAAYIGTHQQKLPPPFGVARNGSMLYGSGGDIYRLDPTTGVSTAIVTGPETDQVPMYSRDGTRFAFFRQTGTGPTIYQLVVANSDGTGQRVVSTDPVTFDYSINWSADGRSMILDDIHVSRRQHRDQRIPPRPERRGLDDRSVEVRPRYRLAADRELTSPRPERFG